MSIIGLVQPEEILNILSIEKSDIVSDVFRGNALIDRTNEQVYLKAYAFDNGYIAQGDRGLLNEIIGYLICYLYQVPQPTKAFLALVHRNSMQPFLSKASNRLKASLAKSDIIPMFGTTRLYGKNLQNTFFHSTAIMERHLIKWDHYKTAVICDEIMANTDRLPRNIITINRNDFWLLDNGRLVAEEGTNWKTSQLLSDNNFTNYLADINKNNIESDTKKGNSIVAKAHINKKNINHILTECQYWINLLSHNDDMQDWESYLQFIAYRNDKVAKLLIDRYGMLL